MGLVEKTVRDVAALIAPTVGWEKSEELVRTIVVGFGFPPDRLTEEHVGHILEALTHEGGLVSVAARFACSRRDTTGRPGQFAAVKIATTSGEAPTSSKREARRPTGRSGEFAAVVAPASMDPSSARPPGSGRSGEEKRLPLSELALLLSRSLGQEKALEALQEAARERAITDEQVTEAQALAMFDALTAREGIVGVTARFAKARLVFQYKG